MGRQVLCQAEMVQGEGGMEIGRVFGIRGERGGSGLGMAGIAEEASATSSPLFWARKPYQLKLVQL